MWRTKTTASLPDWRLSSQQQRIQAIANIQSHIDQVVIIFGKDSLVIGVIKAVGSHICDIDGIEFGTMGGIIGGIQKHSPYETTIPLLDKFKLVIGGNGSAWYFGEPLEKLWLEFILANERYRWCGQADLVGFLLELESILGTSVWLRRPPRYQTARTEYIAKYRDTLYLVAMSLVNGNASDEKIAPILCRLEVFGYSVEKLLRRLQSNREWDDHSERFHRGLK